MAEKPTYEELEQRVKGLEKEVFRLKKSEEALQESESTIKMLLNTTTDSVLLTDIEYTVIAMNQGGLKRLGLNLDEIIGRCIFDFLPSDVAEIRKARLKEVFSSGKPVRFTDERDGMHLDHSVYPVINQQGETEKVAVFARDITEQRKSERDYRALFDKMLDGFALHEIIYDDKGKPVDHRFLAVNPGFERLTGFAASDIIGNTVLEIWPDTEPYWIDTYSKVALTGEPTHFENYARALNRHYEVTAYRPAKDQFACIFKDVTERRRTQEALQWELKVNAMLAELSTEIISCGDIEKIANLVLNCAKELTGSEHGYVTLIDLETRDNICLTLTEMLSHQCKIKNQRTAFPIGSDGKYCDLWGYALNTLTPFYTNSPQNHPASKGTPEGHIPVENFLSVPVMFESIQAGQIALANPAKAYTDKDLAAVDRLGELYAIAIYRYRSDEDKRKLKNQLQQAQKMEAVGTLAGGIAHDFNNILGVITGCTELSQHQISKENPAHNYLNEVLKAAYRAKDLVKQILTFSRRKDQELKPTVISPFVKEALKMLRSSLPATIDLHQSIQTDAGLVMADPIQIHQVIINLGANAAHAMGEKGGLLKVSLDDVDIDTQEAENDPDSDPGSFVKLTVSDTGCGMNREAIERIFDPYFTTKPVGEGTGLGLAVIHGIVKIHGGVLNVHSEPGQGTTFSILFPRIGQSKSRLELEETIALPTGSERILFIDDEEVLVIVGQDMLRYFGYKVVGKTSSLEALEVFRAHPDEFDLVITDQTMPGMTGTKLAEELIRIRQDIPIILCTGYSQFITPEKAKAKGIQEFLMKPLSSPDLALTVRKILDQQD
ncbi:MAG: PAS domain-containing protein [Desulfobacterales bacterium]|uniref:histidine kinase n=1 Tax=Candidatus Desulfatibia vada TaxID=2841696 RepID=A0A8J6TP12_9BACT|nr:PAS domain-containing protein [Candidatus Desulfatibia vada]